MKVSNETMANQMAEFVRIIDKRGPITVVEMCELTQGDRSDRAIERTRYQLGRAVDMGYLIERRTAEHAGRVIYDLNPDKSNWLAVAYTVKEQLANALEDAIVDTLTKQPGLCSVRLSAAIGPMKRPWLMGKAATVSPGSVGRVCEELVERGVLFRDDRGYCVKGAKR